MRVSSDSMLRRFLSAPFRSTERLQHSAPPTTPVGRELDRGPMFSGHMMPG